MRFRHRFRCPPHIQSTPPNPNLILGHCSFRYTQKRTLTKKTAHVGKLKYKQKTLGIHSMSSHICGKRNKNNTSHRGSFVRPVGEMDELLSKCFCNNGQELDMVQKEGRHFRAMANTCCLFQSAMAEQEITMAEASMCLPSIKAFLLPGHAEEHPPKTRTGCKWGH